MSEYVDWDTQVQTPLTVRLRVGVPCHSLDGGTVSESVYSAIDADWVPGQTITAGLTKVGVPGERVLHRMAAG